MMYNVMVACKYYDDEQQAKGELDKLRLKILNKLGAAGKRDGEPGGVGRALWKAYQAMDTNGDGFVRSFVRLFVCSCGLARLMSVVSPERA